jgi:hypothetical protein
VWGLVASALLITACGGDDEEAAAPGEEAPPATAEGTDIATVEQKIEDGLAESRGGQYSVGCPDRAARALEGEFASVNLLCDVSGPEGPAELNVTLTYAPFQYSGDVGGEPVAGTQASERRGDVEQFLADSLEEQAGADASVSCPRAEPAESFDCEVTGSAGEGTVTVTPYLNLSYFGTIGRSEVSASAPLD